MPLDRLSASAATAQEFCVLQSLDSLVPVWAEMGLTACDPLLLQQSAKDAVSRIRPAADAPALAVVNAQLDALEHAAGSDVMRGVWQWYERLDGAPHQQSLAHWGGWLSEHQHKSDIAGIDTPWLVAVMDAYKRDVRDVNRAFLAKLQDTITPLPLSDWDLQIHADFRLCYQTHAQFDVSNTFLTLAMEQKQRLLSAFLQHWSGVLPVHVQQAFWTSIKNNLIARDTLLSPDMDRLGLRPHDPSSLRAMGDI